MWNASCFWVGSYQQQPLMATIATDRAWSVIKSQLLHHTPKIKLHPVTPWIPPVLSRPFVIFRIISVISSKVDADPGQLHVVKTLMVQNWKWRFKSECELQVVPGSEVYADIISFFKRIILRTITGPTIARAVQSSCHASVVQSSCLVCGSRVVKFQVDDAICTRLVFVGNFCLDAWHMATTCSEEIFVNNAVFNI